MDLDDYEPDEDWGDDIEGDYGFCENCGVGLLPMEAPDGICCNCEYRGLKIHSPNPQSNPADDVREESEG